MKKRHILFMGLTLLGLAAGHAQAQEPVRIRIQVIAADQTQGPSDTALSNLMPRLKRMPYQRFRQAGSTVMRLSVGKSTRANVGGQTMNLTLQSVQNGRARVHVNWMRGKASVVNITAVAQPGSPFVCGGPREGDQTWIAVFSVQ